MTDAATPALAAIDWGTTNRRAYLLDGGGNILNERSDDLGLVNVDDDRFAEAFDVITAPWTKAHGELPALLSGMVGASTGWIEAPYCDLPTDADSLAANLIRVPVAAPVWIVPGVATRDGAGIPDVIRGEETQALAICDAAGANLIVMPGTHSKWVETVDGRITAFTTYMTGDLHAAILGHTVIAKLPGDKDHDNAEVFGQGVDTGFGHAGELTHVLFGARSRALFGEMAPEHTADYLSGLLIGAEMAAAFAGLSGQVPPIKLIGGDRLCGLYQTALEMRGAAVTVMRSAAMGATYLDLARRAGIVEGPPS